MQMGAIETTDFETEDLALASYLKMRGVEMTDYNYKKNKVVFSFADSGNQCKRMNIDFLNSECKKFDSEVRDLKKLLKR